ncbi:MAG: IPT/TIG domain-containing protein, partial [Chloroflexi bacterium]|nr:IPT/TIG domain-containing protein [Chloroflexota bacterium]
LASLTFQAVGASGTSSPLTISVVEFNDVIGNPLANTTSNGTISVGAPPTVTSVSPTVGPGRGGTTLAIGGSNFQDGATVSVGGRAATSVTFGSATSLAAVTPRHSRTVGDVNGNGSVTSLDALCVLRTVAALPETTSCPAAMLATTVDVVVANPAGQSGTLASAFTYRHADVNGNGSITSLDALCTLRQVASLPATTSCPAVPSAPPASAAAYLQTNEKGRLTTDSIGVY